MEPERRQELFCDFWGSHRSLMLFAACLVIGAALRYRACLTEFWLDELWSVLLVKTGAPGGAWDIVTNLRHDNNHILNSLLILWAGDAENWFWYRLPALLAGIGSIITVYFCARPREGKAGLFAAFLTAFSFPLILYSSEARGYGSAVFFSLAAFWALQNYFETGRASRILIYNASAALAAFSHLSFVYVFIAFLSWSAARVAGGVKSRGEATEYGRFMEIARLNAFPALVFVFLYFSYLKGVKVGGGPHITIMKAAGEASAVVLGTPGGGSFGILALLAVLGLTLLGVLKLQRERNDLWVFFLCALVFAPALVIAASRPKVIYFRYFVVLAPLFYLVCARLLDELWRVPGKGRVLAVCLLALFLSGQSVYMAKFFDRGRGGCGRALAQMAEKTAGNTIFVGSSDDYLNMKILIFYSKYLKPGKRLFYVSNKDLAENPPDWFIRSVPEPDTTPDDSIKIVGGRTYRLAEVFRYSGFSGIDWFLYRRIK